MDFNIGRVSGFEENAAYYLMINHYGSVEKFQFEYDMKIDGKTREQAEYWQEMTAMDKVRAEKSAKQAELLNKLLIGGFVLVFLLLLLGSYL